MKMAELKTGMTVEVVGMDQQAQVVDLNCTYNEQSGAVFAAKHVLVRYENFGKPCKQYVLPRSLRSAPGFTKATS